MTPSSPNNRPLYNSRIINTYIKLIRSRYSYINIGELLSYAGMEPYQVEDEGHWFTQEHINLFHERLKQLSGNKEIAREAGRYAASPDALGIMRPYLLGLVGPARAYEIVGKIASNFTRSSRYESSLPAPNKVEITVTPNEGVNEELFQCENRAGYMEAIAMMFGYNPPTIEHPECIFRGGNVCRYIVSWEESRAIYWKRMGTIAALLLFPLLIGGVFLDPHLSFTTLLPVSLSAILFLNLYAANIERIELRAAIDKLLDQINLNYNNILTLNEVGQALSKRIDKNDILVEVVQILENRLDYDRGMVFLADKDEQKTRLIYQAGFGYTYDQFTMLKTTEFHLDNPESKGAFVVSFREQRPVMIGDVEDIKWSLSPHSLEFVKRIGAKSFICCPIVYEGESLGILVVDNVKKKRLLSQSDVNLLMGMTPGIGISIHNARLIEDAISQFKSVIQVLAASIETRDPLTAGHSEKVAEYVVGICEEMGMSEDYTEMLQIAALLHDYGKIGIDDNILKKPGRLTPEETIIIRTHSDKTKNILERMDFKGIYREIPEITRSHHENLDGSGYPRGLKEEEIPLGAKIISVADFFEAITSKRHYREPMLLKDAFELLFDKVGSSFDSRVVEALASYYKKRGK
ncbi:MAG: HD domain-containing protein [Deltaproteobacteria bacterium]|nr:HD domain-containing protein [Deltaproteobacteria bacterium]